MERVFFFASTLITLVFADASAVFAANDAPNQIIAMATPAKTASLILPMPIGVDPIVTGPTYSTKPMGILPLLDGCDAECQADRLGLEFD